MAQFSLQMGDVSHMNLVLCVAYGQAELNRNLKPFLSARLV